MAALRETVSVCSRVRHRGSYILYSLRIWEWGQGRSTLLVAQIKSTYAPLIVQPHTSFEEQTSCALVGVALRRHQEGEMIFTG